MAKNKIEFTTFGMNENREQGEVKLFVKRPSATDRNEAVLVRAARIAEAIKGGVLLKAQVSKFLRDAKMVTDEEEARWVELNDLMIKNRAIIKKGGVKKSEGRRLALEIKNAIDERMDLLSLRHSVEDATAEALGEQAHFNCLVSRCTFWAEGKYEGQPYYTKGLVDYLERSDDQAAYDAAQNLYNLSNQSDEVTTAKSPEDDFLHRYGFVNDDGDLIDKDGNLVDQEGNLIDTKGYSEEEDTFVEFLDDDAE